MNLVLSVLVAKTMRRNAGSNPCATFVAVNSPGRCVVTIFPLSQSKLEWLFLTLSQVK